ncbi:ribose-5-phosphate isomerase RpiA [Chitinophaga silvatica]|uniref:Ribose-5-phosphate isomerase A n=1 Tax=Chitinophaga silvatica TaxID=2282649 RepID=A0A3E1Y9D1_9BACT|nr:ribose-5-phosphate isomerase RpiA [Chitinophaga silvatica]RFS22007.1 ribose-5-phosphate isomerase RpiA [Chitinophaga silvatica]
MDTGKRAAGERAVEFIKPGMTIGLGTGSTAYFAIKRLGTLVRNGLSIRAVATSVQSELLASEEQIPLIPFSEVEVIDIDIDGADEVDGQLQLIKGGGGALLREKIIAAASREMIVVVDESKVVETLGRFPLPVEIIPFAWELTYKHLVDMGANPKVRHIGNTPFVTDNGNWILDCSFNQIQQAEVLHAALNDIPGIVENGLFIHYATRLIIGYTDGSIKEVTSPYPAKKFF